MFTWGLLKLDHLFIGELRPVVHQRHAVLCLAVTADRRLTDTTTVDLNGLREGTHVAAEECLAHLWHELGGADDHATDGDELINVWK